MKRKELLFLIGWVIIPLLIGIVIYLLFRPLSIRVFNFFTEKQLSSIIQLRIELGTSFKELPSWFINSLPDGLWIFSFTNLLTLIWKDYNALFKKIILLSPLFIAMVHEIIQLFNPKYGTFDVIDIFTYLFFYLIAYFVKIKLT